jgi:hypothetical protein
MMANSVSRRVSEVVDDAWPAQSEFAGDSHRTLRIGITWFLWRFEKFDELVDPSASFVSWGGQDGSSIHRRCRRGEWRSNVLRRGQEAAAAGLDESGLPAPDFSPAMQTYFQRSRDRARLRMLDPLPAEDEEPPGDWPAGARFLAHIDPEVYEDYGQIPPITTAYYDAASFARFLDPILHVMSTIDAPAHSATFASIRRHALWWIEHDRQHPPERRST